MARFGQSPVWDTYIPGDRCLFSEEEEVPIPDLYWGKILTMIITDPEAGHLKQWVVQKLTDISDADSDVLADYVLALVRVETPEPELRANAIENLEDFLQEKTKAFVDELFTIMHAKSYMPGYVQQQPAAPTSAPLDPPSAPSAFTAQPAPTNYISGAPQQARKRSYNESTEGGGSEDTGHGRGERQFKQMRRGGGRGNRGDTLGGRGRGNYHPPPMSHGAPPPSGPSFQGMPLPPPPPGSFDDPMAMMTAMQAMGLPPLPGMPPFPQAGSPPVPQYGQGSPGQPVKNKINARCRDYDTKGYCTRGVNCPFQHENSVMMPDQEYDPKNAVMTDVQMLPTIPQGLNSPLSDPHTNGHARGGARGRGRGDRGGYTPGRKNRADFSHAGPNHDRSITTVVVEQIPEENFDEQSVRNFFTQFGTIDEVDMRPYKRLALVKFRDWFGANHAYSSPKVIFDNRFVKVFWYKPTTQLPTEPSPNGKPTTTTTSPSEPEFDKEKFMRDAEAAQKKLEEKRAALKDSEEKRQALEKQTAELAKRQAEEKRKLQEKLAAKGQGSPPPPKPTTDAVNGTATATNGEKDDAATARTKALKEQVAALEAEAKSLGLDHALSEDFNAPPYGRGRGGRGRRSYRGWEGFAGSRGTYQARGRGTYRGRGGGFGGYNLDLRPRKVSVSGVEWTPERDEGLRQYLLALGEYEDITSPPPSSSSQQLIITFKQRAQAETFFFGTRDIPSVGKIDMAWVSNTASSPPSSGQVSTNHKPNPTEGGGEKMEGVVAEEEEEAEQNKDRAAAQGMDYDVGDAEEDFDVA
ncbi:MAG: hypothetical protein Q9191_007539 [Dirinaria sp. TL-2023a]